MDESRNQPFQRPREQSIPSECPGHSQHGHEPNAQNIPSVHPASSRSRNRYRSRLIKFISTDSASDSGWARSRPRGPLYKNRSRTITRYLKDEARKGECLRAMEISDKFMGWLWRPRVELGIMDDKYRKLEEEVRLKYAVERSRRGPKRSVQCYKWGEHAEMSLLLPKKRNVCTQRRYWQEVLPSD